MSAGETKATQAIDARMTNLEPGTPRYEALEVARRFKTSWIELGGALLKVRTKQFYKKWGYPSFESYCKDEIRIKPRTAAKLTASFSFLKEEEPSVLKRDGIKRPIPEPEAVEVLMKAKENSQVDEEGYRKIREMAFDAATPASLRKEYRQSLPPAEPQSPQVAVKKLLDQANKLADSLAAVQGIPRLILERALALVDDIRSLVEN